MLDSKRIGVVVLAYKVEKHIKLVVDTIPAFVDKVYVVNDCSPDNTADIVERLCDDRVRLINHKRNLGPGAGLCTGYVEAYTENMDVIVKIDGDGQMNPDQIEDLLHPILSGEADYAKGERLSSNPLDNGMTRFRLLGNTTLTILTRIASGLRVSDAQNGYTAITSSALTDLLPLKFCAGYGYLNDILVKLSYLGYRVVDVPMVAVYRNEKSSIRLGRYILEVSRLLLKLACWKLWRTIIGDRWILK